MYRTTISTRCASGLLIFISLICFSQDSAAQITSPELKLSTFFGGSNNDHFRDVALDSSGSIYLVGGTQSSDFPTTPGVADTTFNGDTDVIATKLSASGQVIWSTVLGGPSYDRAYGVEVDSQGFVYLAGRAGQGFPSTSGALQTQFRGGPASGPYPSQDFFFAKLAPDGKLVFSSFFGAYNDPSHPIRDLAIDSQGNIIFCASSSTDNYIQAIKDGFKLGFQPNRAGGKDGLVAKVSSDGKRLLWASFVGGSGDEWGECSVRTDINDNIYFLTLTNSLDMPSTSGAYSENNNGGWDFFLTKIDPNGRQIYGTYLGGSSHEHVETHELWVDHLENAYIASASQSADYPITPGVVQTQHRGGRINSNYQGDIVVSKISADGSSLLLSTFLGGSDGDAVEGVAVDRDGNVYLTGGTYSQNFPLTSDAAFPTHKGSVDAFIVRLSADFKTLDYSTFIGGSNFDPLRTLAIDASGSLVAANSTSSTDFPLKNPIQSSLKGQSDAVIVKFQFTASSDSTPPAKPKNLRMVGP